MPFGRITSISVADQRVAVCINKDGSLLATWRYRGPDLDSSVEEELSVIANRMQASIAAMKTGFTLYFEAQRVPSTAYETTNAFPDIVTRGMDAERCRLFSSGMYFESHFYATLLFLPPKDRQGDMSRAEYDELFPYYIIRSLGCSCFQSKENGRRRCRVRGRFFFGIYGRNFRLILSYTSTPYKESCKEK